MQRPPKITKDVTVALAVLQHALAPFNNNQSRYYTSVAKITRKIHCVSEMSTEIGSIRQRRLILDKGQHKFSISREPFLKEPRILDAPGCSEQIQMIHPSEYPGKNIRLSMIQADFIYVILPVLQQLRGPGLGSHVSLRYSWSIYRQLHSP